MDESSEAEIQYLYQDKLRLSYKIESELPYLGFGIVATPIAQSFSVSRHFYFLDDL